jgi:hypothetical protein
MNIAARMWYMVTGSTRKRGKRSQLMYQRLIVYKREWRKCTRSVGRARESGQPERLSGHNRRNRPSYGDNDTRQNTTK